MSIQSMGLLELPKVRRLAQHPGYFEIITGHRRIKAISLYLGRSEVKCRVEEGLNEIETFRLALAENIQRSNLSAYEEGQAYLLCEKMFGLSDEDIAEQLHKPKPTIMLRRQLASDANRYLRYCNDSRMANLFLQNFKLRHRRMLKRITDKGDLAKAVTMIAEGSPIRHNMLFAEEAKNIKYRVEDYEVASSRQRSGVGDIDDLADSILEKVRKLSLHEPEETKVKFSEVEQMVRNLKDEAKIFRRDDLDIVGLDSIKEFACPNCRETLEIARRLNKTKNVEVLLIGPKNKKLAKEPHFIMYPRL